MVTQHGDQAADAITTPCARFGDRPSTAALGKMRVHTIGM
jgi:hypothetical protein